MLLVGGLAAAVAYLVGALQTGLGDRAVVGKRDQSSSHAATLLSMIAEQSTFHYDASPSPEVNS